jgi:hypothetical protein
VLVTPEIDAMLDGHLHFGDFPQFEADRLIAVFSANWLVTVSKRKADSRKIKRPQPDLERLEGFDEVFALCARKPAPGWRILGRFYEQGVFVATRAWDKKVLFSRYSAAAQEVIEDWDDLFGDQEVHRSDDWSGYIGEAHNDVD